MLAFVARHADPFDRAITEGHLTGSAFVLSRDGARVLLSAFGGGFTWGGGIVEWGAAHG